MCTINSSVFCRAFILMIHVHHSTCIPQSFYMHSSIIKLMNVEHFMVHLVFVTTHLTCVTVSCPINTCIILKCMYTYSVHVVEHLGQV